MRVLVLLAVPAFAFVPYGQNPSLTDKVRLNANAFTGVEPKEMVKLFGRLAEKYIMLDDSGGMCCYSGCSGEKSWIRRFCCWGFALSMAWYNT